MVINKLNKMNISIIGPGLIGGSIALDLKNKGNNIIGVDIQKEHLEQALQLGLINKSMEYEDAILNSDVIILSIPVNGIMKLLPDILDKISKNTTVIDVGSIKTNICNVVLNHPKRSRFVAAHPLAGTEFSGPKAALKGLFKNKYNIICEEDKSDEDALEVAIGIFNQIGMTTMFMNPVDHDKHLAYVSHLSHISSFMLGQTVLEIEKDEKQIFNLASTGFESTVRLAKSSADTWVPIFINNQKNISDSLEQYIGFLTDFKNALDSGNKEKMYNMILKSNDIRRVLSGMKLNIVKLS